MKLVRWSILAAVVLAVSVYVSPVYADSIGPDGCAGSGCFGGVWTLEYALVSGTQYDIFYTVNTAGMSNATFGNLTEIAFKVTSQGPVSASVVSSPTGWGTNAVVATNISNTGCDGSGAGWVCSTGAAALTIPDGTYEWEFLVDIGASALFTAAGQASIQANGTVNGNILSQNITLQPREGLPVVVPEPTTFLLVGSALAGVGLLWGRKQRWGRRAA
jgi:hypothetical protein